MKPKFKIEEIVNIIKDEKTGKFYATLGLGEDVHFVLYEADSEDEAKFKTLVGKELKFFIKKNKELKWFETEGI